MQSVVSRCIISWFGNLTDEYKKVVNRIVKSVKRLVCTEATCFDDLYNDTMVKTVGNIMGDCDHRLFKYYQLLPPGFRINSIYCRTNRYKFSFVPSSIRSFNGSLL